MTHFSSRKKYHALRMAAIDQFLLLFTVDATQRCCRRQIGCFFGWFRRRFSRRKVEFADAQRHPLMPPLLELNSKQRPSNVECGTLNREFGAFQVEMAPDGGFRPDKVSSRRPALGGHKLGLGRHGGSSYLDFGAPSEAVRGRPALRTLARKPRPCASSVMHS